MFLEAFGSISPHRDFTTGLQSIFFSIKLIIVDATLPWDMSAYKAMSSWIYERTDERK